MYASTGFLVNYDGVDAISRGEHGVTIGQLPDPLGVLLLDQARANNV